MIQHTKRHKGIALALAGGGARGFTHVGVIKIFVQEGIPIVEVSGSSMGAIVAAYFATHGDVAALEEFGASLDRRTMLRYIDPCLPRHSLMKGEKLRQILTRWFGDTRIEETLIPLAIVATKLRTAQPVVFRRGPIADILLASAAIPGLLPAVKIDGEFYVDGSVALPLPLSALRTRGAVKVGVALPALSALPKRIEEQPRLTEVLALTYASSRQKLFKDRHAIILRPASGTASDTLSFQRSIEFLKNGEKAAKKALPKIRRRLV